MNRAALIVCGLVAASFALTPVNADGNCSGVMILEVPNVTYYVQTGSTPDNGWGYIETNGEDGLQRGGVAWHGNPDPCQSSENPDTIYW